MKFKYTRLGKARIVPSDDYDGPGVAIYPDNWITGVRLDYGNDRTNPVIGAVQENPSVPGHWRAVVSTDGNYPAVDFKQGLWPLTPGRSGFKTRRDACLWLAGVYDARSPWFAEALRGEG